MRPLPLLFAAALSAAVLGASPAAAQTSQDKTQSAALNLGVALPVPQGHCPMSEQHPAEREIIELTRQINQGRNLVMAMFADCAELESLRRQGRALDNYGGYLAPLSAGLEPLAMPRSQFLAAIAQAVAQQDPVAAIEGEMRERVERADLALEVGEMSGLGLIHQDDTAVYTGVIQSLVMADGSSERVVAITGITLVQGHPVSVNLFAPFRDGGTVESLLVLQRQNLARFVTANAAVN
ncbi:MAG: hypothetical protein OEM59_07725 [Rhodospirillales bacterium]|nr:hypothetical protein [Rhodospirillales bacterium]